MIDALTLREEAAGTSGAILLAGDRLRALASLRRGAGHGVKLAYLDLPRIEGFDEQRAFKGESGKPWDTWLSVVREHTNALRPLLREDGIIVLQAGDLEESYARLVGFEIFGHSNYVGSAVWRTHYSPKGGKSSQEIANTHEVLICFALDREQIPRVALWKEPTGYSNPDGDPYGDWEARQKDAGRDTARIEYHMPPYRWSLVGGELPEGLWRVSPMSGVIARTPTVAGTFSFEVSVTDAADNEARRALRLVVREPGAAKAERTTDVWWMSGKVDATGPLLITTDELPEAVVGEPYSAILEARGGQPFTGQRRPKRGWAFGEKTLKGAILDDRCYFGQKGDAIPETKKYLKEIEGGLKAVNLDSWWDGAQVGWTQDATKHLNELKAQGHLELVVPTSKPPALMRRVLEAFTSEGDLVLEVFGRSADLASEAIGTGRRPIALAGEGEWDEACLRGCALPRMLHSVASAPTPRSDATFGIRVYDLGPTVATLVIGSDEYPVMLALETDELQLLCGRVLTAAGFLEVAGGEELLPAGVSIDGKRRAVVVPPDQFLDDVLASELIAKYGVGEELTILYFRCEDDLLVPTNDVGVRYRRVPMDFEL